MPDARTLSDLRPSPDALLHAARRESRGRLKIFLGAAPGVGKTYEMLEEAAAKRREGAGCRHRRRRDPWPQGDRRRWSQGLRSCRGGSLDYKGHRLEEMDLDAILRRRPDARPRRRAGPHQCRGQPPSQTLHGCGGTARGRHRRVHHDEHSACREPERRGGADHPHPRAGDRAGCDPRSRRRHRGDRHHAPGPDPATRTKARSMCPRPPSAPWPTTSRPAT